jgi:CDP-diacylglycerol--serine O-phosphatidyltransferase
MFIRLGHKSRDVPLAMLAPNVLTALALCCGLASVHLSLAEKWEKALAAIVLAGVFDVLDGLVARMLRVSSRFGAVLDSLSDFLAFGIAPAIILHQWILAAPAPGGGAVPRFVDTLSLVAVMIFALCSAMRLARFTAAIGGPLTPASTLVAATANPTSSPAHATKARSSLFFVGLATPAGAGAALVPAFLAASDRVGWKPAEWVVGVYLIVVALLMVSRAPTFALKGVRVPRQYAALVLVVVVVLATLMLREPWLVLAALAGLYLLTIPWAMATRARQRRRDASATASSPPGQSPSTASR